MPIYEYSCTKCGQSFERRLSIEQRLEKQVCTGCGHESAVLRMSVPAIVGAAGAGSQAGVCPSTGEACGCGHAVPRH